MKIGNIVHALKVQVGGWHAPWLELSWYCSISVPSRWVAFLSPHPEVLILYVAVEHLLLCDIDFSRNGDWKGPLEYQARRFLSAS